MKLIVCILLAVLVYILWQQWELTRFEVSRYQVVSHRLKEKARAVVIADLHGFSYGKGNSRLLDEIRGQQPDLILIPGDLIVSKYPETFPVALNFLKELVKTAPVYYSFGNHETRLREPDRLNHESFCQYLKEAKAAGVHILNNESADLILGGAPVRITGLELPLAYYEKGRDVPMESDCLSALIQQTSEECFSILLAHNPLYAEEYAGWGADLTFCGHNHGGLIRLPGGRSIISPQFTLFPKYDGGEYKIGGKKVIVSRGLGTHTFHIRIFNRAELVCVDFLAGKENNS